MKRVIWDQLDAAGRMALLARPAQQQNRELQTAVAEIIANVRRQGDVALKDYTQHFDGCMLETFPVEATEFAAAEAAVSVKLRRSIASAIARIERFHQATAPVSVRVQTAPGVVCERLQRPINRVGLYVPAGSAPLFSTVMMLGVPARLAACPGRVMCTPPRADGRVDPLLLYTARQLGITEVFKLGGAQAIAAMAVGTDSVPRCDKLFGPGNAWVTEAKYQVSVEPDGPAIDMPAGPSEVLVIADRAADPRWVAADLLSQAEHGADSHVLLVTDDAELADAVLRELGAQLAELPRAGVARQSLSASRLILVSSTQEAAAVSNVYAPEHLILNVREPRALLERIESAGSVFLGGWSPEAAGDYSSGTNHVLPTYGHARAWSGLSVASFQKQITVQELNPAGLRAIGPDAVVLADAEGLTAHARAVSERLKSLATT
jgi:histidinol dehydrogenase